MEDLMTYVSLLIKKIFYNFLNFNYYFIIVIKCSILNKCYKYNFLVKLNNLNCVMPI